MSDLQEVKQRARKAAFARRKAAHEASGPGEAALLSGVLAGYRGVPVAGYMAIRSEIDPLAAMEEAAAHGPVGVPVIAGPGMPLTFARWTPGCALEPGPFGAMIPAQGEVMTPEIVIVPLVAFDRRGGRLGYGGGFYDRTLELLRAARPTMAIGFAYGAQEDDALPLEATDQPLDMVVTESEVIEIGRA
ncbi:MAG: 5-formyltetrahydrofolate cyclo-ligase [Pseudomonadota bacterium]|uniref:5-formyltetrahydrofolate cyclo-ligase n=1 Tax=Roseovarius TaxID=74030 RepID=UPI0022A8CC66|nr:5-formyltetrahydrofolate cyclo-ligase [Roseovarius sp. EGI FJ00037]MCZ0812109.1 5-formyltetrahydrofolate cyclo-ligase [Roseovarius sp. EGI FJ00037]